MGTAQVDIGFLDSERDRIGALYWEAFRQKLRPAFTDDTVGLRVIRSAMRSDRLLVARTDVGGVAGVCGFRAGRSGAADMTWGSLRGLLPFGQAVRAALVLSVLARSDEVGALVLDGICVDGGQRGAGIGTALLDAAELYARSQGLDSVQLSVIDSNPRARALYERRGFVPEKSGSLGLLGYVYGFDGYTVLRKKLTS